MANPYLRVLRTPHALPMVLVAFIGRLPLSMVGLGTILLIASETHSYGLGGAVWSADQERSIAVARQIKTGNVLINGAALDGSAPFGGFGQSGFGRENGRWGIEEFTAWKALHL